MNTLTIKGMHCDACKKLITMELEDAGLQDYVTSLELSGENMGALTLSDSVSEEDKNRIREVINAMEGYTVV